VHDGDKAAYYRDRADECRRCAEVALEPATRNSWTEIANAWAQLALHFGRKSPTPQDG
jgi:hypothetical protein